MMPRPSMWRWIQEERPRAAKRMAAVQQVSRAVKTGKLAKPSSCERCGASPDSSREIHGHHHDYDKPLEVEWLCRTCHVNHHRETTKAAETARRARLKDKRFRLNPIPHD